MLPIPWALWQAAVTKNTVFFDNVRVPAFTLIGGENNGWRAASTHLELEHGAGGRIGRHRVWDRLLRYCQETKRDGASPFGSVPCGRPRNGETSPW